MVMQGQWGTQLSPSTAGVHFRGQCQYGASTASSPGPGQAHKRPLKHCPASYNHVFSCLWPHDPCSGPRRPVWCQARGQVLDAAPRRLAGLHSHLPLAAGSSSTGPSPTWEGCSHLVTLPPAFCCLLLSHWWREGLNPILTGAKTQQRGKAMVWPSITELHHSSPGKHIPLVKAGSPGSHGDTGHTKKALGTCVPTIPSS